MCRVQATRVPTNAISEAPGHLSHHLVQFEQSARMQWMPHRRQLVPTRQNRHAAAATTTTTIIIIIGPTLRPKRQLLPVQLQAHNLKCAINVAQRYSLTVIPLKQRPRTCTAMSRVLRCVLSKGRRGRQTPIAFKVPRTERIASVWKES